MTNGEVYALLRRRRDERNAKLLPSFGLQFTGQTNSPHPQQRMSSQKGGHGLASTTHNALFLPPQVLVEGAHGPSGASGAMTMRKASESATIFSSPVASHLVVLVTEVCVLRYLNCSATISGANGLRSLYGPTSLHTSGIDASGRPPTNEEEKASIAGGGTALVASAAADNEERERLAHLLRKYRPGTVGHVRALEALLRSWEHNGYDNERRSAMRVKDVFRTARQRLQPNCLDGNGGNYALAGLKEGKPSQRSSESFRTLFAPPSIPLAIFMEHRSTGGNESHASGVRREWTEKDVLQLVLAKPRDSLDVNRALDDFEGCAGYDEELVTLLEEQIVQAFV
ncbi:hypothetical protein TRVL_01892 [Trypanosoma vivax]|nr:hypothetical protein TRVL_01892 [Trypanosoma vivax]